MKINIKKGPIGQVNCGVQIHDIASIYTNIDGYCIYLYKEYDFSGVSRSLLLDFDEYAQRIGNNAVIFKSTNYDLYNNSLKDYFQLDPWFSITVGDIEKLPAGIFIIKPSLQLFSAAKGQVFIYLSQEVINDAYKDKISLSQDIVDLCRHDIDSFITRILKYSRGAIINPNSKNDEILKTLKDSVIIEPNLNGLGLDIKPLIKGLCGHNKHAEKEKPIYDCVVYRF